jgi:hypothetical protein
MQPLPNNSLILGGYSNSYKSNTKKTNFYGATDYWFLKLLPTGGRQWDKTIAGGGGADYLMSVQQTKDKGFILGGYSNSNIGNNKTENSRGDYDYWIVKTDSLGNVQWDKTIGGNADDILTTVYEVDSNRYVVAGTSASSQSGDKSVGNIGSSATDYWVITLGATSSTDKITTTKKVTGITPKNNQSNLDIMPNPVKNLLTIKYSTTSTVNSKINFDVFAANGTKVLQTTLTASDKEIMHSFNVANLSSGSYFAVMYDGNSKITKTFTKE